jgi:ubiquinone/menaquinone biosynthesis C-methylase UbiE
VNAYDEANIMAYFQGKADKYDLVEEQVYWQLSDRLLWNAFNDAVLSRQKPTFTFLDAGGGTGRWSEKILKSYNDAKGYIYDLSNDMLAQAEKKRRNGLEGRMYLKQGNIENMNFPDSTFDITFNFHN